MNVRGRQVPVMVTYRKETGYTLALAFMPELRATHPQFEKAGHKLRQAVRHELDNTETDRGQLDRLLWAVFAPEFRLEFEQIAFESGPLRISGLLAVLYFEVGGCVYACLPMLDALLLALDGADAALRAERIIAGTQAFFREQRKKLGDAFDPDRYLAQRSDSCMPFDLAIQVRGAKFPFEGYEDWFTGFRGRQAFDGRVEMPRVAEDLNQRYPDDLMQAVLRDEWIAEISELLYQQTPGCLAIVGPVGCGKTAVLHETLRRHIAGSGERDLARMQKMWHIDPLRVISGMSVVGQWQRRTEAIVGYAISRLASSYGIDRTDQLVCDNMVALFRIGKSSQNSLTLADALRPYLERRQLTLIAEATPEEWQKMQEYDRRFAELFRVVRLPPPSPRDALSMIAWQRARLEQQYRCTMDSAAIQELLKLTQRFYPAEAMPGPAVRAIGQLALRHEDGTTGIAGVRALFQATHHFREKLFARDQVFAPNEVERFFAERLIGQAPARGCLADVAYLIKSGLARPGKPLASLLFIGPTGVGKTEAAKVLAQWLFGDDPGGLMRFDMNEFVDAGAVTRLIGDKLRPDGQLTTAVRQRKACVLLLDEIEKADPAVHDLLLQVLGEGRLTDALGRTTDFSQCVIVMTSNLGAAEATRVTGFVSANDLAPSYREAVERFFRPEFLNRIDRQVAFSHLGQAELSEVARLHIGRLLRRDGFVRRMTFLNVDEATVKDLAASGYDPQFGARALKRHIERLLTGPTAARLAMEPGDRPMILDVRSEGGTIVSRATLLDYATPRVLELPALREKALPAYRRLQRGVDALQTEIWRRLDTGQSPHAFELRALQDRLRIMKERIDNRCWHLEERRVMPGRSTVPRKQLHRDWYMAKRSELNDLIAQSDIAAFFDGLHEHSERMVEEDPYYLDTVLQLHYWYTQFHALCERGVDHVCIELVSRRSDGTAALSKAWACYETLFRYLDVTAATPHPVRREGIAAEYRVLAAPGLETLLAGECGMHLWFAGTGQAYPLSVRATRLDGADDPQAQAAALVPPRTDAETIIRLHHESSAPYQFIVTDLRSNLVRRSTEALAANDWTLLLYHGKLQLPADLLASE